MAAAVVDLDPSRARGCFTKVSSKVARCDCRCFLAVVRTSRSTARLLDFYNKLLKAIDAPVFRDGEWRLCERSGWPDNSSFLNLVAWCWTKDDARYLVIVNLSEQPVGGTGPGAMDAKGQGRRGV